MACFCVRVKFVPSIIFVRPGSACRVHCKHHSPSRDMSSLLQNKNIKTIRGNQLSRDDLHVAAENGPFDIIIDDPSHINDGIMLSLGVLLKSLVSGGLYIVEDLACAIDRSSRLQDVNEWIDSDVVDKSSDVKIIYHQPEFHIRDGCVRHFMTTGKWKSRILSEEEGDYIINNVQAIDFQSHHNMIIFQKK